MKQFFEQYGAVALGILALLVLIAMITPVGNIIKTSLQGTVHTFSSSIESQHDDALEAMEKAQEMATYGAVIDVPGTMVNYNGLDGTTLPNTWTEADYVWPAGYSFGNTITIFSEIYLKPDEDFSIEYHIFGNWESGGGGFVIRDGNVSGELYINRAYQRLVTSDFPLGEKFTMALTYDGSIMKLFINGELKNAMPMSGNIVTSPYGFIIGGPDGIRGGSEGLHRNPNGATMYRVGVYDGALTEEQVKSLENR